MDIDWIHRPADADGPTAPSTSASTPSTATSSAALPTRSRSGSTGSRPDAPSTPSPGCWRTSRRSAGCYARSASARASGCSPGCRWGPTAWSPRWPRRAWGPCTPSPSRTTTRPQRLRPTARRWCWPRGPTRRLPMRWRPLAVGPTQSIWRGDLPDGHDLEWDVLMRAGRTDPAPDRRGAGLVRGVRDRRPRCLRGGGAGGRRQRSLAARRDRHLGRRRHRPALDALRISPSITSTGCPRRPLAPVSSPHWPSPSHEERRCDTPAVNDDPDPRYSLANERTFLAWIRTSLGLLAAAAALLAIDLPWPTWAVRGLSILLGAAALFSAFVSWDRWRKVERAIAERRAAPPPRVHVILTVVVAVAAVAVVILTLASGRH